MNRRWHTVLLYGGLALLLLLPRLPALGSFATADEPYWLSMGANFYYALGQREFQNTVYEYQPAVTTMWIVTAAMMLYYPQYRGLGQGYLEFEKGVLDPFLLQHGKDPLILLRDARLIQVLLIVGLLLVAFYLLRRLVGDALALSGLLLASFDPFFLGQSRLLDHEALLACFILISILAMAVYLFQGRRLGFLLLSALAAALAQLTKSSGIVLLVPIGLLLLWDVYRNRTLLGGLKSFGLWLGVLIITYVLFWPGMWVAPGKMLYQVYGNAFSYAFRGARLIALDNSAAPAVGLEGNLGSFGEVASAVLWHTTLFSWIGALFALVFLIKRSQGWPQPLTRGLYAVIGVTGFAVVTMFAVAQGRNSPHYTLTSYLMFNLLAAVGWLNAFRWFSERLGHVWVTTGGMALLVLVQAWSALAYSPYYFTYQNPLLTWLEPRHRPLFAYGEGLELAGKYLAELPDAHNSVALAYYSRGCFSYFFPGQAERFKPYYVEPGHEQELRTALDGANYLVLYPAVQDGLDKYAALFGTLSKVAPLKEIWLDGYRYVAIYRLDSLPPDVYEALYTRRSN